MTTEQKIQAALKRIAELKLLIEYWSKTKQNTTRVRCVMQDDIRANLMRDLYKQIPKSTNKDLASAIEYLKSAIEIRSGKSQKRRDARKKYKKKQIEAADFPFWWQSSTRVMY